MEARYALATLARQTGDSSASRQQFAKVQQLRQEQMNRDLALGNIRAGIALAEKRQYKDVVAAIDAMEKKNGSLPWPMQMQRLYALQAIGETSRASELAAQMSAAQPDSV